MPVSSPSYFPPNRTNGTIVGISAGTSTTGARNFLAGMSAGKFTDINDLIVIGNNAVSAGTAAAHITDVTLAGSIAIGSSAMAVNTAGDATVGNVAIGFQAGAAVLNLASSVLLGYRVLGAGVGLAGSPFYGNVLIGAQCAENLGVNSGAGQRSIQNVLIGFQCAQSQNTGGLPANVSNNVTIGYQANRTGGAGGGVSTNNVIIGIQAATGGGGQTGASCDNTVIVGGNAGSQLVSAHSCVYIGSTVSPGNQDVTGETRNVVIGASAGNSGRSDCVLLGAGTRGLAASVGFVCIGPGAGQIASASVVTNSFVVESAPQAIAVGALMYGQFDTGNMLIGNSSLAQREFSACTNAVKLVAGTIAGLATPIGGGLMAVVGTANDLNFVNSAGNRLNLTGTRTTPAALGANVNDYSPAGLAATRYLRLSTSIASANITGLDASVVFNGFEITLVVLETSTGNVVLTNQDAASAAGNRFVLPGLALLTLTPGSAVRLWYDGASTLWRKAS